MGAACTAQCNRGSVSDLRRAQLGTSKPKETNWDKPSPVASISSGPIEAVAPIKQLRLKTIAEEVILRHVGDPAKAKLGYPRIAKEAIVGYADISPAAGTTEEPCCCCSLWGASGAAPAPPSGSRKPVFLSKAASPGIAEVASFPTHYPPATEDPSLSLLDQQLDGQEAFSTHYPEHRGEFEQVGGQWSLDVPGPAEDSAPSPRAGSPMGSQNMLSPKATPARTLSLDSANGSPYPASPSGPNAYASYATPGSPLASYNSAQVGSPSPSRPQLSDILTTMKAVEPELILSEKERDTLGDEAQTDVDLAGPDQVMQVRDFHSYYEIGRKLNAGAQGVTYVATDKATGKKVVVKQPNDATDTRDYYLLKDKTHPNIVRIFEMFETDGHVHIVMEFCEGNDLFHALGTMGQSTTQNWCAGIFKQVLTALKYLHEEFNECHNDIKPENIFLDRVPRGPTDVPKAMLGDFGCLTQIGQNQREDFSGGDPRYRAPELFDDQPFNAATDVWSLGVTLFEIVTGGLLIHVNQQNVSSWNRFNTTPMWPAMRQALIRGDVVDLSPMSNTPNSNEICALLHGLLDTDPWQRWRIDAALQCQWIQLADKADAPVALLSADRLHARARNYMAQIDLINLVANVLQGESIEYYTKIWKKFDENGNQRLELSEFKKLYDEYELGRLSDGGEPIGATQMFNMADTDDSAYICFEEFMALMFNPDTLTDTEMLDYLKEAFGAVCGDDQKMCMEEFAAIFTSVDQKESIRQLFDVMDTDHNGFIDFKEFAAHIDTL